MLGLADSAAPRGMPRACWEWNSLFSYGGIGSREVGLGGAARVSVGVLGHNVQALLILCEMESPCQPP